MDTFVKTGIPIWDSFCPTIKEFLSHDKSLFTVNGKPVSGYRSPDTTPIWLRDHAHQMKGFKYFEKDMTSALDMFSAYQMKDGAFYDFFDLAQRHTRGSDEQSRELDDQADVTYDRFKRSPDDYLHFSKCGVESDVEYLAVEAVYGAWQATGDDEWMAAKLPALEKGMEYSMTSPVRWSPEYGLVKRPFTIDTWDFEYCGADGKECGKYHHGTNAHGNYWCIMHGDNAGMVQACALLAKMYGYLGNTERTAFWNEKSKYFKQRTNEVCWNGRFYTHQVHITPVDVVGVDEKEQLSLSNSYDMNRGLPDHDQCVSIIREYMRRREANKGVHMAEWYSIDPTFPPNVFGLDYLDPGVYVNGGIMPLVGGELAHAAFDHGFEDYGADILNRYYDLCLQKGETFLWYYPDGTHAVYDSFLPTDGWGSAAMLYAFIEGLCGVKDSVKQYDTVDLAPKWSAAGVEEAEASIGYAASDAGFRYEYKRTSDKMEITAGGTGSKVNAHVLLPKSATAKNVRVDGNSVDWSVSKIEGSNYVDFSMPLSGSDRRIEIEME